MYAEGTGPRAIAALNDRAAAWNEQTQRDRYVRPGVVRVCDPEPVRNGGYDGDGRYGGYSRTGNGNASAYDVTYEYAGRRYTRRMDYHPGDRVRVRVDVSPQ